MSKKIVKDKMENVHDTKQKWFLRKKERTNLGLTVALPSLSFFLKGVQFEIQINVAVLQMIYPLHI